MLLPACTVLLYHCNSLRGFFLFFRPAQHLFFRTQFPFFFSDQIFFVSMVTIYGFWTRNESMIIWCLINSLTSLMILVPFFLLWLLLQLVFVRFICHEMSHSTSSKFVDHTYRDFSRFIEEGGQLIRHKKCHKNFPAKVHQMLSDSENSHIVTWMVRTGRHTSKGTVQSLYWTHTRCCFALSASRPCIQGSR